MDARVGLLFVLVLSINWATDARNLVSSDLSGFEEVGKKVDVCTFCEQYASEAVTYLSENKTQTEVIELLQTTCSQLHSLKEQCITLVDYYATIFFSEVSSMQADEFCKKVNLCEEARISSVSMKEDKCDVCQHAVAEILQKLQDPDAKLEIIEMLLKGCDAVENYVKKCKAMVFEYGPQILANAQKFLEHTDICSTIHACSSPKTTSQEVLSESQILMVTSS
ncbi:hypothetical protein Ancab_031436 [Ancistrocladus abbreviatus]